MDDEKISILVTFDKKVRKIEYPWKGYRTEKRENSLSISMMFNCMRLRINTNQVIFCWAATETSSSAFRKVNETLLRAPATGTV